MRFGSETSGQTRKKILANEKEFQLNSQGIHIQIHTEELNFKLRINLFLIIYPIQYNIKYN